ncbi:MAG: hypothetical protein AAGI38_08710 [Bacteroidota bacterium]
MAYPIIWGFFGVRPMAHQKTIHLRPQFPDEWPSAELKSLPIGENTISLKMEKKDGKRVLIVDQTKEDWEVVVHMSHSKEAAEVRFNGKHREVVLE